MNSKLLLYSFFLCLFYFIFFIFCSFLRLFYFNFLNGFQSVNRGRKHANNFVTENLNIFFPSFYISIVYTHSRKRCVKLTFYSLNRKPKCWLYREMLVLRNHGYVNAWYFQRFVHPADINKPPSACCRHRFHI